MRYIRKQGFYAKKSGGYLVVYPYSTFSPIVLHPSSVVLYSLIDGVSEKSQIFEYIRSIVQNETPPEIEHLEASFQQLIELGLIEKAYAQKQSLDFITVGFKGFWDSFDPNKNYFLEALSHIFIPIIVDPAHEVPSLIFIGDEGGISGYNHLSQESISIGVKTKDKTSDNTFDLTIASQGKEESASEINIPLWAIHFTWIKHYTNKTPDHHLFELNAFSPKYLGERMLQFLDEYYKEEFDGEIYNFWEVKEQNPARITNFNGIKKGALTIGMATYDDYDGVYFTVQSLRLYHPEVMDKVHFLIVDNHPGGAVGEALQKLESSIPNYRYLPFDEFNGTATRDLFFREAQTEYVMSIDSHVLLTAGSLHKLFHFLDSHPDSLDLFQGPMIYDDLRAENYGSSFRPEWGGGMYGVWYADQEAKSASNDPFEIQMHGLGLFVCRKEAWLGFNSRFRGFGGEEGYIHEKFRLAGRKTICLPFMRWLHRFGRPNGTFYANTYEDRIRNYYLAFNEIGWDTAPIDYHFTEMLGKDNLATFSKHIWGQLANPLYYFDAVYFLVPPKEDKKYDEVMELIKKSEISHLVRFFHYEYLPNGEAAYDRANEKIVDNAIKYGFNTVMIIQDKVQTFYDLLVYMARILKNIEKREWASLHIGSDIRNNYISLFDKSLYVPNMNRPPNACIAAFNLEHYYALAYQTQKLENKVVVSDYLKEFELSK